MVTVHEGSDWMISGSSSNHGNSFAHLDEDTGAVHAPSAETVVDFNCESAPLNTSENTESEAAIPQCPGTPAISDSQHHAVAGQLETFSWRESEHGSQGSLKKSADLLYAKRFLAYRLFSILVLLSGLALVVMHAGGQLALPVFSPSVSGGIIDKQTATTPGSVRPARDVMSILFCVLWACAGLLLAAVVGIVCYRIVVPARKRRWRLEFGGWRMPEPSEPSSALRRRATKCVNLIIDLTEKTSIRGPWFWWRLAAYFWLDTLFQFEALFSYGGYSLLTRKSTAPVEDWPIMLTHAILIALDIAVTSRCFHTGHRYVAEISIAFGDIGYTLDRLLLIQPAPGTSSLDPLNWHVFRAADPLAFLTDISPILGFAFGLLAVDGLLQGVELAAQGADGEPNVTTPSDAVFSASWVFRPVTPTATEQHANRQAARAAVQPVSHAHPATPDVDCVHPELETEDIRTPRPRLSHRQTLVLHLLAVAAGVGLVVFVCFQQFWSECGHISAEACSWRVHPLAAFPSCDCQISTISTVNFSSAECNDVPAALRRGHQRTMFLFVTDTPPAFRHCALEDAHLHSILSSLSFLVTLNAPHQNASLLDQAALPYSPQLRYMDLFLSPTSELSLSLAARLPNLDVLFIEYAQVTAIDPRLLDHWGVRVIHLFSTPLCRNGGTPELRALQERHPGRLRCEAEFASSAEVTALLDDQDVYCGTGDKLTDPLHVLFTSIRLHCMAYGAQRNRECLPMCGGLMAFAEVVDEDGDGYLALDEMKVLAPLYAGRELESQAEFECLIRNLPGCDAPAYTDKMQIEVLYIGITGDEIRGVVGSDCTQCELG